MPQGTCRDCGCSCTECECLPLVELVTRLEEEVRRRAEKARARDDG